MSTKVIGVNYVSAKDENMMSVKNPHISKLAYAMRDEKYRTISKMNLTKDIKEYFDFMLEGIRPKFYKNVRSSRPFLRGVNKFFSSNRNSNCYYTLASNRKDWKKTKAVTSEDICSIFGLAIDVDFHQVSVTKEELRRVAAAILYFSDIQPTAIIVTGRGLQLIFKIERIFLNHENVELLVRKAYAELKDYFNKEVFSQISFKDKIKCDPQVNPINQKLRVPGSLNYSAEMYAELYHFDKIEYRLDDLMYEITGKEYVKKVVKPTIAKKKVNKNSNSIVKVIENRIQDVQAAMLYLKQFVKEGYRNNGYLTLTSLYKNLADYKELSNEDIVDALAAFDKNFGYFRSVKQISSMVERGTKNFKSVRFTNKAIEEYCIALQMALDYGFEFKYFFRETVSEQRKQKSEARQEKTTLVKDSLKDLVKNGKTIKDISLELNISRNTAYKYLKELFFNLTGKEVKDNAGLLEKVYAVVSQTIVEKVEEIKEVVEEKVEQVKDEFKSVKSQIQSIFEVMLQNIQEGIRRVNSPPPEFCPPE